MKIPQIPPLPGCTPLGVKPAPTYKIINGDSTRKQSDELFDAPFNLAGELVDNGVTAEGEARVRALAESEARKAQAKLPLQIPYDSHKRRPSEHFV